MACLLIHIITEVLAFVGKHTLQFLRKFLIMVKVMTYLFGVIKVQGMLINDLVVKGTNEVVAKNFIEVLLLFDISFFYFSIVALMIFNTLIRCRKFHTIKERIVGNTERFKAINGDSLYFAREDLHYITIVFARLCLFIYVEINRISNSHNDPMRFSIITINIINMIMVYHVFFAAEDNNIIMDPAYRKFRAPIYLVVQIAVLVFEIIYLIKEDGKTKFYGPLVWLDVTF